MIDLTKFCSKDAYRVALTTPWNDGEYACATDGRIFVRAPRQEELPERGTDKLNRPDYRMVIKIPADAEYFTEWPVVSEKEKNCIECEGSGTGQTKCETCDGLGEHECPHCDQDMDCRACKGTGWTGDSSKTCPECHGAKTYKYTIHMIGGNHFGSYLLDLIKDLPGIQIAKTEHMSAAYFKFDGGDGAIMPTREGL